MYSIHKTVELPIPMEKAWDFFSRPENLSTMTPTHMNFRILNGKPKPMYAGQLISYYVSPFKGIKVLWVTEITHVTDNSFFVDEQRIGPYKLWHHQHFIKPIKNGVLVEDIVHYAMPYGFIGKILNTFLVRKKLRHIFEYESKKLIELFGSYEH